MKLFFIQNSKSLGNPLTFQKVKSQVYPLYKRCWVFQDDNIEVNYLGFSICPSLFSGDRANTSLVRQNGDKVFLPTIQQSFYPKRHPRNLKTLMEKTNMF